jgi:RND family efflux transporter MFP subunit
MGPNGHLDFVARRGREYTLTCQGTRHLSNTHYKRSALFCSCAAVLTLGATHPAMSEEIRSCVIVPSAVVDLSVSQPGVVRAVHVGRGDAVVAGDLLIELDDTAIAVEIAVAERRATDETQLAGIAQRLEVLEAQMERMQSLTERALARQNDLDRLEDQVLALYQERDRLIAVKDLAALDLQRVQAQLAQRVLHSPTDGIITARLVEPGEYASEQRPVLTVAALDPLHVELFLPLSLRDRITVGDEIIVLSDVGGDGGDMELTATVDVIDKVSDAASSTFGVRLTLPNPDLTLPAGVRCRVEI